MSQQHSSKEPPVASSPVAELNASRLQALKEKYDSLVHWRMLRDSGGHAPKAALAATARLFPGALQELDRLTKAQLESRRQDVVRCLSGQTLPQWLKWINLYHALLLVALSAKRNNKRPEAELALELEMASGWKPSSTFFREFLILCQKPPHGRLKPLALQAVAAVFSVQAGVVADTLFPPRHRGESATRAAPPRS